VPRCVVFAQPCREQRAHEASDRRGWRCRKIFRAAHAGAGVCAVGNHRVHRRAGSRRRDQIAAARSWHRQGARAAHARGQLRGAGQLGCGAG